MNNVLPINKQPTTITTEQRIKQQCKAWRQAKRDEEIAKAKRLEAEKQLIELTGFDKLEGSATVRTSDLSYRVTMTAKLNRRLDPAKWQQIKAHVPENLRPVEEKTTYKVVDKGCRYVEANYPELWRRISACMTTTPAKTAVKVEILGDA